MSPLECSECFGDQLLHRTYTWHLTLRGTSEPSLRLHNLHGTPRCARQAAPPRLGRRVVSQHAYPLNRFSSVPGDPMERPTASQADPELDYNPPWVQLSDEMFVFQDGRWVNENCRLQPPYFSPSPSFHHKLHKRLAKERLLQEENKSLREENKALREENNKILQVLWEEHKAARGGERSRAPSPLLHEDSRPLEAAKKYNAALQTFRGKETVALQQLREENRTLQLLMEENRTLQRLLEQRQAYWAQTEDKAVPTEEDQVAPSPSEEPHGPGLLPDQGPGLSSPFEESKGPSAPQEDAKTLRALREMVNNLSGPSEEEEGKAGPGLLDGGQCLQLLREMNQALQALREENRAHVLWEEHRAFQEESKALWKNSELKLQQKLVIDTVTEVTARMEMLIEELSAFMPTKSKDAKKPSRV
ncbi:spermatid-associated protein isoform X2 [Carlito syrichta]|uniref:Protein chibby homolog 2 n=1 Tax=Carlito syrichta TaxID=1868482 RepID=A0A1U7U359_CARSF|nr:spermatid-associated protein isoform X2 [Carlito syrichta]